MAHSQFNTRCAGVKRLMKEAMELKEPTDMFWAQPCDENLFEWHFTIRGPAETDFDGGIYHGRIVFPSEYPMKPPNLMILTPNGRFELNKKICLSISGYHPETWLPSWSIRTALLALIGFMPSEPGGAIGSLKYPPEERKRLAKLSVNWTCKECGLCLKNALKPIDDQPNLAAGDQSTCAAAPDEADPSIPTPPVAATALEPSESTEVAEAPTTPALTVQQESVPKPPPRPSPVQSSGLSLLAMSAISAVLVAIFVLLVIRRVVS